MDRRAVIAAGIALCCGVMMASGSEAATYYVRADGGTHAQCSGTADVAYADRGHGRDCAWNNPMEALPPSQPNYPHAARIKGGDTLVIEAGAYRIGWTAGVYDRAHLQDPCDGRYANGCTLQPVPSGTAAQPTRILGAGWDSGCKSPPQLYGTQSAKSVIDLTGSSHVVIACLDLTDHAYCTLNYRPDPARSCKAAWVAYGQPPDYGDWAAKGIYASDSDDVTLQDLNIHGFADQGVQAGRISNWTVTRVTLAGNGNVGWNGDLGGNNHNSTSSGKQVFTGLVVKWNGCQEHYPPDGQFDLCYGQEQGGYGDGMGLAWTGGDWTFIRPKVYRNTSDGLDLLYANGTGTITVEHGYFARNVGNGLKTAGNATITDSVFIEQCAAFRGSSEPVAPNPCRAGGGVYAGFTGPNERVLFSHNTVVGEAGCLFGGDPVSQTTGAPLDASDVYRIENNIFVIKPRWNGDGKSCLFWNGDTLNRPTTVQWTNNIVWPAPREGGRCETTGIRCVDPRLRDESMAAFDPTLLPDSPARGAANGASGARAPAATRSDPDIGAIQSTGTWNTLRP